VIRRGDGTETIGARLEAMGLLELLIIILVLAALFGGIAVSPLLFVLLIVVFVILFTRGGFGYRRGGRL
jgi:predicted RND superfamily exporter protein